MVDMVTAALRHIAETSPAGAIIASVLVALALILILAAWSMGVLDDRRNASQRTDFQSKLLQAIEALNKSETVLREENAGLREDVSRLVVTVELLREQNRRVIELLRGVMEGRVALADLRIPDLGSAPS